MDALRDNKWPKLESLHIDGYPDDMVYDVIKVLEKAAGTNVKELIDQQF